MARIITQFAICTASTIARTRKDNLLASPAARTLLSYSRSITTNECLRADRRYTDKHEWVIVDEKIGTVGISDYAQDALGDVVYIQLPDIGSTIKKGDECGALESVKAVSELISPVSGTVVAKNETVEGKPGLVNTSCYKDGWLFKVELTNQDEIKDLMDEKAYNSFLKSDTH